MRVALVHNFHRDRVPSGEDVVVRAQALALQEAGHDVCLVSRSNDDQYASLSGRVAAAAVVATGLGPDPLDELRRFAPDVVHVHNLFPNFGSRWLADVEAPLVATLHNFRPICAVATLLRDGQRCVSCVSDPWAGVRHACFQGSRLATLPLAVAGRRGAPGHPLIRRADRLVVISARARDEYVRAGVDAGRFVVVPNAVPDLAPVPSSPTAPTRDQRWLFLGRLSAEKGIEELLDLWPDDVRLDVVGDGELGDRLRARPARASVGLLGQRTNDEVRAMLPGYTGLVVPSLWPEAGPPLTYVEALAAGVPTLAWEGNGAADDVVASGTGLVVERTPTPAAVATALAEISAGRDRYGSVCRAVYEERFSVPTWVERLLEVYEKARRAGRVAVLGGRT